MRIHIPSEHAAIGNSFGYRRAATELRRALAALHVYSDCADAADACVYVTPPHLFPSEPRHSSVLFTMFEGHILPPEYLTACARAGAVVVPSRHNQLIFSTAGVKAFRCPLGVDGELFRYSARKAPAHGRRFRFLWVGAPNPRKGWPILDRAWKLGFANDDRVELYVKTTSREQRLERDRNVIADSRTIDDVELADLYASAHCFVFPSYGEGFGLTLAEAMSTGLPAVFTNCGGVTEFASRKNGYPVKTATVRVEYFGPNRAWAADIENLTTRMRAVLNNYPRALMKGRRAADFIATNLTWRHSAERLKDFLAVTFSGN
jgi:glycosyltransferase involved in cell wall biosynthesis